LPLGTSIDGQASAPLPPGWEEAHTVGGGRLRAIDLLVALDPEERTRVESTLSGALLLVTASRRRVRRGSGTAEAPLALARRILQRGWAPPLHPDAERRLLSSSGFSEEADTEKAPFAPRLAPGSEAPETGDLIAALAWSRQSPRSRNPRPAPAARRLLPLLFGPAAGNRLGLALVEALARGWIAGGASWTIEISQSVPVAAQVLPSVLDLFSAVSAIAREPIAPRRADVLVGTVWHRLQQDPGGRFAQIKGERPASRTQLKILLQPERETVSDLPDSPAEPTIVIRSRPGRPAPSSDSPALEGPVERSPPTDRALTWLAQLCFAAPELDEHQLGAAGATLSRQNCAVHLPPGAGKGMAASLAALLSGEPTLVVEPTETLVSWRIGELGRHGIDRIERVDEPAGRSSEDREKNRGLPPLFVFATADQLRSERWRSRLRDSPGTCPFPKIVIDTADALSERSPEFRPAYADLPGSLTHDRVILRSTQVVALVSGGRKEVRRDVLWSLSERGEPTRLVESSSTKPSPPLEVVKASARRAHEVLCELLLELPRRFRLPAARFYRNESRSGPQGLILCSRTEGSCGVVAVRDSIRKLDLCHRLGLWSEEPPEDMEAERFERRRAADLAAFTSGELPLMVAAGNLGLGLHVPRLRYVVWFGLPPSVEVLEQQAFRLSGDESVARIVIHVPQSESRFRALLAPETAPERISSQLSGPDAVFGEPDDLARALAVHGRWFQGLETEIEEIRSLLNDLMTKSGSGEARSVAAADPLARERAAVRLCSLGVLRQWLRGEDGALHLFPEIDLRGIEETTFWRLALRTAPERTGTSGLEAAAVPLAASVEGMVELCRRHLDDVYAAIEPGRRRALAELDRLVSKSRKRVLPVRPVELAGELRSRLEALAREKPRDIAVWLPTLADLVPQQIDELEQVADLLSTRLPDDPAPHLLAALGALFPARDRHRFRAALTATFVRSRLEHGAQWESLQKLFAWLLPRVKALSPAWAVDLWTSWEDAEKSVETLNRPVEWPHHLLRQAEIQSLSDPSQKPAEAVVVLERRLREACGILDSLKEHFSMEESEL
jgi:hypothetical protein